MHNINYKEIDVSKDMYAAMEMMKKSGQRDIPVIDINGNIVVGFDPLSIDKLLGL